MSAVHTLRGPGLLWLPVLLLVVLVVGMVTPEVAHAQTQTAPAQPQAAKHQGGGEANLKIPDLAEVSFGGMSGRILLQWGLLVCLLGFGFGLVIYQQLKNLPVHQSMREISELIYETCKTYLVTQGKFLLVLWIFIAVIVVLYFGVLSPVPDKPIAITLPIILLFSLVGIAGSYGVAWFGIRVNT